jgi:excisionase family DNA binding protein
MTNRATLPVVPFERQPAPRLDELQMLRVPEAATLCGISARHMYDLLRSGTITPTRFGRSVRVTKAALWRYIAAQDQGDR